MDPTSNASSERDPSEESLSVLSAHSQSENAQGVPATPEDVRSKVKSHKLNQAKAKRRITNKLKSAEQYVQEMEDADED